MTRKFKVNHHTTAKFNSIQQAESLEAIQKTVILEGTEFECQDLINDAGNGHLELWVKINFYGKHLEEIKPETTVTQNECQRFFGKTLSSSMFEDLNRCLKEFEINTPDRICHFMAHIKHESGNLKWLKELASGQAYEGRRDLGNTQRGDGRRFKGAGVLQLTGRFNYSRLAKKVSDPQVMQGVDYVSTNYPFTSAGVWWSENRMNFMIDNGATINQTTKKVNGGYNGLVERTRYFRQAQQIWR